MSPPKPIRIAVFGAGAMGSHHLRNLVANPSVEVSHIVDENLPRARSWTAGRTATAVRPDDVDYDFDAAIVATPTHTHAPLCERLLQRGIHTLVEKPIASTAEQGRSLQRLAQESGAKLMVGHVERFSAVVRYLTKADDKPFELTIRRIGPYPVRIRDSVVTDLMIHDIDLAMLLMGSRPSSIHAVGNSIHSDDLDVAHVVMAFSTGMASLHASRAGQQKIRKISATYLDRYVTADLIRQDVTVTRCTELSFASTHGQALQQASYVEVPFLDGRGESLANEHAAFIHAIQTDSHPPATAHDGIVALDIALQIERLCVGQTRFT